MYSENFNQVSGRTAPLCEMRSRIASVGDYLLITTLESRYRTQTTSINGTRETDSHQKAA